MISTPTDNQRLTQKHLMTLKILSINQKGKIILSMNMTSMQCVHQRQSIK